LLTIRAVTRPGPLNGPLDKRLLLPDPAFFRLAGNLKFLAASYITGTLWIAIGVPNR